MSLKNLQPINKDSTVNVFIEIPMGSHIKYEFNEELGVMEVDRFSMTTMGYPCNYGAILNTLGGDGDPLDVIMITRYPIMPGCLIKARVIGALLMVDESGEDEKILCLPTEKADRLYYGIDSYRNLPAIELDKIKHFFERYKDLDEGKWVKVEKWQDEKEAMKIIQDSIARFKNSNKG